MAARRNALAEKARIAERLAVTPKTVQRSIAGLEEEGLLKRVNRFNNGRRVSNEYDLALGRANQSNF